MQPNIPCITTLQTLINTPLKHIIPYLLHQAPSIIYICIDPLYPLHNQTCPSRGHYVPLVHLQGWALLTFRSRKVPPRACSPPPLVHLYCLTLLDLTLKGFLGCVKYPSRHILQYKTKTLFTLSSPPLYFFNSRSITNQGKEAARAGLSFQTLR